MADICYGSMCSGIEAASCAWHPLGWRASFLSEIDRFPRAVLSHHYPTTPLHGDFTTIRDGEYDPIDVLVAGTPCQDFSIAGLRAGIAGDRGNLTLQFVRAVERLRPKWVVWENVPGILSLDGGRAFGSFLGGLGHIGYGFAYRVLDAQYFELAQRRARVFVVAHLGDWRRAAAVLFERESLRWDSPPSRETGERVARPVAAGSPGGSGYRNDADTADNLIAAPLLRGGHSNNPLDENLITHALRADGFDTSEDGTGTPLVPMAFNIAPSNSNRDYNAREAQYAQALTSGGNAPSARGGDLIAFSAKDHGADASDISPTLRAGGHDKSHANAGVMPAVAFNLRGREDGSLPEVADVASLRSASGGSSRSYIAQSAVRRLTPRECCRLQGFPDDYLDISYRGKPAADGPKYKALGNSMAVPVMRWIGRRIEIVEGLSP